MITDIPLKVLIVDPSDSSTEMLAQALKGMRKTVLSVKRSSSLAGARNALVDSDINAIYIDPLSLGLEEASQFIFDTRRRLPSIVFVLYLDFARMEGMRADFYSGERRRFAHYFKLDKLTPIVTFTEEAEATIRLCQGHLSVNLTREKVGRLQEELASIQASTSAETVSVPMEILRDIQEQLESLKAHQQEKPPDVRPKTVFLSHRFPYKGSGGPQLASILCPMTWGTAASPWGLAAISTCRISPASQGMGNRRSFSCWINGRRAASPRKGSS